MLLLLAARLNKPQGMGLYANNVVPRDTLWKGRVRKPRRVGVPQGMTRPRNQHASEMLANDNDFAMNFAIDSKGKGGWMYPRAAVGAFIK
jgi:hypothetical protein